MKFTKMQSHGNDYVYIELLTQKMENESRWARFLSRPRYGVGSDGMVLICPSQKADFRMRIFNPDGSEAEMCGNAIRSVAKFVYVHGFTKKTEFTVETLGGIKNLYLHLNGDEVVNVTAEIGAPILEYAKIPVSVYGDDGKCINYPVEIEGRTFYLNAVSVGNPHCAVFIDGLKSFDVEKFGRAIETSVYFPKKANVEFVEVIDRNTLFMRTWERNCGETLACGTGCCVSVVSGVLNGICDSEVTVLQLGGETKVKWDTVENKLYMTSETEIVFEGETDLLG